MISDGTVWAWGNNTQGQLGDGTKDNRRTPAEVIGLTDITSVSAGEDHVLALRSDGSVWAWGNDRYGEIGDGKPGDDQLTPVKVPGLSSIAEVSAGWRYSFAVASSGDVYSWGHNKYGTLGDGTREDRSCPEQLTNVSDVVGISAGMVHSLAVRSDGTVSAWGKNAAGELGDGTRKMRLKPVSVDGLQDVTEVAAGEAEHSLAVLADGTVWAWGANTWGELGDGTETDHRLPARVFKLTNITAVSAGYGFSLALATNGTAWSWGLNVDGALGDGTTTDRPKAVEVKHLDGVTQLTAGLHQSLAVAAGSGWSWGYNKFGQLGDGTNDARALPGLVAGLPESGPRSAD